MMRTGITTVMVSNRQKYSRGIGEHFLELVTIRQDTVSTLFTTGGELARKNYQLNVGNYIKKEWSRRENSEEIGRGLSEQVSELEQKTSRQEEKSS